MQRSGLPLEQKGKALLWLRQRLHEAERSLFWAGRAVLVAVALAEVLAVPRVGVFPGRVAAPVREEEVRAGGQAGAGDLEWGLEVAP